jgi:ADP-ribosylglycohydrolase
MKWYHLPIQDVWVPERNFEDTWDSLGPEIRDLIRSKGKVLIHCRGGLGRSGTIAARLLIEFGSDPEDAINQVRKSRPGAIETRHQEQYVLGLKGPESLPGAMQDSGESRGPGVFITEPAAMFQTPSVDPLEPPATEERYRGCLLGGAVGDALGAPVEFSSLAQIRREFGESGIRDFVEAYGKLGAITDDTQMTLFTAEGCIRAWHRFYDRGICSEKNVIYKAYQRWLKTQGILSPELKNLHDEKSGLLDSWLLKVPELNSRRAPGNTCLTALIQGMPVPESKGCGGIMRVAPIGLWGSETQSVFSLASDAAEITHGHPSGFLASGFLAVVIAEVVRGIDLESAIESAMKCLLEKDSRSEVVDAVEAAIRLSKVGTATFDKVEQLGQGWTGEEALAISLYCALTAENFEEGVVMAVNHGGDSDSTGSITGQILGALYGFASIPNNWLDQLELRDTIDVISRDLYSISFASVTSRPDASLFHRYPPN